MKRINRKFTVPLALTLATWVLTGCGGGGGSSPAAGTKISGAVIDGYITGARVCLDTNTNLKCDDDINAISGDKGSYSLTIPDGIDASKYHVVVDVGTDAVDSDAPSTKIAKAYTLLAPAKEAAVITPLTTFVSHAMLSKPSLSVADAKTATIKNLNLPSGTDFAKDYIASPDTPTRHVAIMAAAVLAQVQTDVVAAVTPSTETQKTEALKRALKEAQTVIAQYAQTAANANSGMAQIKAEAAKKGADTIESAKATIKAEVIQQAAQGTSTPSTAVAAIEAGFYNGSHVLEACSFLEPTASGYCTPHYSKVLGSGGKITLDKNYRLGSKGWENDPENGQYDLVLTSSGWMRQDTACTSEGITYSVGSDGLTTVKFCNGITERLSARKVDAAGQTLKALGLELPQSKFETVVMPSGSQLFWFDFANNEDRYSLYTGDTFYTFDQSGQQESIATLDSLIAKFPSGSGWIGRSGLTFSFDAGGNAQGGKLTLWSQPQGGGSYQQTGNSTYRRLTVHGQELLIIDAQAPENDKGELILFAVNEGKVYGGSFRPKDTKQSSEPVFNKTMMNAILKAGGKPEVLD